MSTYPDRQPIDLCTTIALRNGGHVLVRPLLYGDKEALARYFCGLSERTKSMYGPHPFNTETARRLCAQIEQDSAVRFVALLEKAETPAIIGYMILDRHIAESDRKRYGEPLPDSCACLAPSIADAYQEQGLGTAMAHHVLESAHRLGIRQVILMGGVVCENTRAVRLYERLGFRRVRQFWTNHGTRRLNKDMILDVEEMAP